MRFQYLGTAAAEGFPAIFCSCDSCKRAIASGGRNLRTRSQGLIDNKILIDFPADTCTRVIFGGLELHKIHSCLITHSHSDHLYAADFEMRRKAYGTLEKEAPLTVYGTDAVGRIVRRKIRQFSLKEENRVVFKKIVPFITFDVEGYKVTALNANHDPSAGSVFYLIENNGKSILYANDTGWFPDDSWAWLVAHCTHLDFVSLDCTGGTLFKDWHDWHMGINTNSEVVTRLKEMGIADESTIACSNHFSHNCGATYDEILPIAAEKGLQVSYDGMVLDI
ncbi:MAG: MBL fold metallo-hydrolase [Saccharofermentanales bacterium]